MAKNQRIVISLEMKGSHHSGYKWEEIKDFIDNVTVPSYSEKAVQ